MKSVMDCMFVSSQNSCVEALISNVTVCGGEASKGVIKVKGAHKAGAWSDRINDLIRRKTKELALSSTHMH